MAHSLGFRYIPSHYTPHTINSTRADGVEVHISDANGFYAVGFKSPKKIKDDFHHKFKTAESREKFIARWLEDIDARAARKQALKDEVKATKAKGHSFTVGMILVNSWGYEQTNIDFWQVVEVKGDKVTIREIGYAQCESTDWEQYDVTPAKDQFLTGAQAKTLTKIVNYRHGVPSISADHGCFRPVESGRVYHKTSYY